MQRETATVYEFPAGGRASRSARSKPAAHPPTRQAREGRIWPRLVSRRRGEEEQTAKLVRPLFTDRV